MLSLVVTLIVLAPELPPECEAPPTRDVSSLTAFAQSSGSLSVGLDSVATWCFDSGGVWTGGQTAPKGKKPSANAEPTGDCAKAVISCVAARTSMPPEQRQVLFDALGDLERPFLGVRYKAKRSGLAERPPEIAECSSRDRSTLFSHAQARMDLARLASQAQSEYANYKTWLFSEGLKCAQAMARGEKDFLQRRVAIDQPSPSGGTQQVPVRQGGSDATGTTGTTGTTATGTTATGTTATGTTATGTTATGTTATGTTATGTTATGTTATGTTATGTTASGTTASGTTASGTTASGTTASGTTATGKTATGTTAPGTTATGTTATGTTATGTTASGTTATGKTAIGTAVTGTTATGTTATGSTAAGTTAAGTSAAGTSAAGTTATGTTAKQAGATSTGAAVVLGGPTAEREKALNASLLEKWRYFLGEQGKIEGDADWVAGFVPSRELRDCHCIRPVPGEMVRRLENKDRIAQLEADDAKNTRCELCLLDVFPQWKVRATKQCALALELTEFELGVLQRSDDGNGLPPRCIEAAKLRQSGKPTPSGTAQPGTPKPGVGAFIITKTPDAAPPEVARPTEYAPLPAREAGRVYVRIFTSASCTAEVLPGPVLARTGDLLPVPPDAKEITVRGPCGGFAELYFGKEEKPRLSESFARNQPLRLQFRP